MDPIGPIDEIIEIDKDVRNNDYLLNSSGSNIDPGLDDSKEFEDRLDGSDTSGTGSDGKGNVIKVLF